MPRLKHVRGWRYEPSVPMTIDLIMGDHRNFTREQLRAAWDIERDSMMRHARQKADCTRPWAFWVFDLGEDPPEHRGCREPDPEPIRLAELGELTPEEVAGIRENANVARTRVGTDSERISGGGPVGLERPISPLLCIESFDRIAVALEERVLAALEERA